MHPVYPNFFRHEPKRRKINPKEPPKTLSQEKSWNRVFLMEKRKRDLKSEQKKGGARKDCPKKGLRKR